MAPGEVTRSLGWIAGRTITDERVLLVRWRAGGA